MGEPQRASESWHDGMEGLNLVHTKQEASESFETQDIKMREAQE